MEENSGQRMIGACLSAPICSLYRRYLFHPSRAYFQPMKVGSGREGGSPLMVTPTTHEGEDSSRWRVHH